MKLQESIQDVKRRRGVHVEEELKITEVRPRKAYARKRGDSWRAEEQAQGVTLSCLLCVHVCVCVCRRSG